MRRSLTLGSAVLAALLTFSQPAAACLACIEMPQESLADLALAADAVALLRPAPGDPFRFAPVAMLKGDPALPPVPFLVSRARAAELAADPQGAVVATWTATGGWAIHDFGGSALAAVLADVLSRDLTLPETRRDVFAPLVLHPEPAVARMAMVELARLPYPILRQAAVRMDRRKVASMATDPLWSEWAPAAIVLLGLSDDPSDAAFVRRAAAALARDGRSTHMAAWMTALVEADAEAGLDWLVTTYGHGRTREEGELRQLGLALASHAMRDDSLGAKVRAVLPDLAARSPAFAAAVAGPLMERDDWSLADAAARWVDDEGATGPGDAFILAHYVFAANEARSEDQP